jgi:HEPN domain-containing protein
MRQDTQEWVDKAEGDWKVAQRELAAPDPVFEAVCFHAQQSAEKYLKAVLDENRIRPPRTHDLAELADLAAGLLPQLASLRHDLVALTASAVAQRYPGSDADAAEARQALDLAEKVRAAARGHLGI